MDLLSGNLALALLTFIVGAASPGPATLLIAATSMERGRRAGLATAAGICCGSCVWGLLAAGGFAVALETYAWLAEGLRIMGGLYLIYLAVRAARASVRNDPPPAIDASGSTTFGAYYSCGLLLHLTNPKAVFVWLSTIAIAVPAQGAGTHVFAVFLMLEAVAIAIFATYAVIFATAPARAAYRSSKRYVDGLAAVVFGAFGIGLLLRRV